MDRICLLVSFNTRDTRSGVSILFSKTVKDIAVQSVGRRSEVARKVGQQEIVLGVLGKVPIGGIFSLLSLAAAVREAYDCTTVIEHMKRMRQMADARSPYYDPDHGGFAARLVMCRGCRREMLL